MQHFTMLRVAGVLLGATFGFNMACLSSAYSVMASKEAPMMMYDFRALTSLDNWSESSDTVRTPGMSKGAFVIQKSQLFQRAVLFSMLNPQPNGAGFVGFVTDDAWDLKPFSGIELKVRAQGESFHYKVNFKHKGQKTGNESPSYEAFYEVPKNEWTVVTLPFTEFKPYFRGQPQPDAEPLDTSAITSVTLQIHGGVYSEYKQHGTSSLEIDYIRAV
ncbi:uncharacterized protein [Palaemon carinicauda]|uniref:uncharacterized protein n=1 Tax=Palaemon carinicauda TaxID=392227 RepID=UPI0035B5E3B8